MSEATCELCGEPMPAGEQMFKFHGYSGPCPTNTEQGKQQIPACRICGKIDTVICYPDDHSQTICPECCDKAEHANGEHGHEWKHNSNERDYECQQCGILKRFTRHEYSD